MKINQSKNRRMLIMEQISLRQHSRQKSRKSSAQRRKKVQQSLTHFMKTMSDVSYRQTGGSETFKFQQTPSQQKYYSQLNIIKNQVRAQNDGVLRSPSFKDINILEGQQLCERKEERDKVQVSQGNRQVQLQLQLQREEEIEEEEIVYRKERTNGEINQSENVNDKEQKQVNKSVMGNESSASAIFFTSQFNDFISKNHYLTNTQHNNPQTQHNNQSIDNNSDHNLQYQQQPVKNSLFSNNQENIQQSQQKPNSKQLQQQKHKIQTSYQSQQKALIPNNHQQLPQSQQIIHNINQLKRKEQEKQPSQLKPLCQQQIHNQPNVLLHNKSNHSLAFSNQSSLKYSLNESNIRQIINQKFTHQLIAHTNQFNLQNQNSSLLLHLKFQILVDKFHLYLYKNTQKQLCSFFKLFQLSKKVLKRQKRTFFQAFLINQQLNLQEKKNEIKSEKYLKQKQQEKLYKIFNTLKQMFYLQPRLKSQKAINYQIQKQNQKNQKIFRCLKIAWFDQKVKKQIDLYYLSKLFSHFNRVIKMQKQTERKKYLSFYCFNLKKRFFNYLKQGVQNIQTQRIQRENASFHYQFGLTRKVFDAWRDKLSYKDRYISLAMTTKNTFKETSDQRWMQIRTVDFRQIK